MYKLTNKMHTATLKWINTFTENGELSWYKSNKQLKKFLAAMHLASLKLWPGAGTGETTVP